VNTLSNLAQQEEGIEITIPGRGHYRLAHLVLDVNGTVAAAGRLVDGVRERLLALRQAGWSIHWITADTRGRQVALDAELGWPAVRIDAHDLAGEAAQKAALVRELGGAQVIAIGNGANDAAMLHEAALGVAVLGPEGLARDALLAADLIVPDVLAALDLLRDPSRLVATLRR
jgi:P-type E1-E2 ATPase